MEKEENPLLSEAALKLRKAYRQANRLIVSAGLTLAGAGVAKDAPELKALRLALRAVNVAGGMESIPAQEDKRAVSSGRTAGTKERPHGYPGINGPRFEGPGKVA